MTRDASSAKADPGSAEKPLVLVVDDNEDNRDLLSRRLKRKGYDARVADDGPSALDKIGEHTFELIILDVMMPGMSGIEVLHEIRKDKTKTELPVIMATAKSDSADVVEALNAGANDYVTKPIDFPVLLARVESQLAIREEASAQTTRVVDLSDGISHGTIIEDRYEILEPIGEGGFAVVYKAKQLSTGQTVAFKCAKPERVRRDEGGVELARFEREMQLIGKLRHANIVRLVDSGTLTVNAPLSKLGGGVSHTRREGRVGSISGTRKSSDGNAASVSASLSTDPVDVPYIVMEYLAGESLNDKIKAERRIASEVAVDLMLPVLSALGAAHEQGIVHRDVKPHNILLVEGRRGVLEPKVLDFGIAKLTAPDERALTVNESFIGTPEYMPPEQAKGTPPLDGRADQFAAAAILYHAVTGQRLYKADNFFALVHAVAQGDVAPPSSHVKDVPLGLEVVLMRALSGDRDKRYPSAEAFAYALLPWASPAAARRWDDVLAEAVEEIEDEESKQELLSSRSDSSPMSEPPALSEPAPTSVELDGSAEAATVSASAVEVEATLLSSPPGKPEVDTMESTAPDDAPVIVRDDKLEPRTQTPWLWIAVSVALALALVITLFTR